MPLWRVDVAGISHRFVAAESKDLAEQAVALDLLRAMDVRAAPAAKILTDAYDSAGPVKRKRLLAAMDGLTSPRSRADVRHARRQLERLVKWEDEASDWVRRNVPPGLHPVDPLAIDRLVRMAEVQHIEHNLLRLRTWEANSPLHD